MSEQAIKDARAVHDRILEWSKGHTHWDGCQSIHLLCACADAIEDLSNCLALQSAENTRLTNANISLRTRLAGMSSLLEMHGLKFEAYGESTVSARQSPGCCGHLEHCKAARFDEYMAGECPECEDCD